MKAKLPWFKFFATDWLSDPDVRVMSSRQRGWYIDLLCLAWQECGFHAYHAKLICQVSRDFEYVTGFSDGNPSDASDEIESEFGFVLDLFTFKFPDGRLSHPKLEHQRGAFKERQDKQKQAAKSTNAKRSSKRALSDTLSDTLTVAVSAGESESESDKETICEVEGATAPEHLKKSIHCSSARNETRIAKKAKASAADPLFEEFWSLYWRKDGKAAAALKFRKYASAPEAAAAILAAVREQSPYYLAREAEYRPLALTWLNQQRWLDKPGADPPQMKLDAPPQAYYDPVTDDFYSSQEQCERILAAKKAQGAD